MGRGQVVTSARDGCIGMHGGGKFATQSDYTIPRVPECMSLRPNWLLTPPPPASECVPPLEPKGGGNTHLRVIGQGKPIRTTGEKSLALCLHCGLPSSYIPFQSPLPPQLHNSRMYSNAVTKASQHQLCECRLCIKHRSVHRARICKRLRSTGIDSAQSIPPAYVDWQASTTNRVVVTSPPGWESIPGLLKRFTNTGSGV